MGEADLYLLIGDQEQGPWTLGQVQNFLQAGAVTLETLCAQPGMSEWKPLSAILDVAPPAAPTPTLQTEHPHADEERKSIETVVNVIVPSENVPTPPETDDTVDEPVEPDEMDLPKTRQWLRDKLLAIGFRPDTEKPAPRLTFRRYSARFSGQEQEAAFGKAPLEAYRRGEITANQLVGQGDSLITLEKLSSARRAEENLPMEAIETRGDVEQFTPENALWIMEIVERVSNDLIPRAEPTEAENKRERKSTGG